MTSCLDYQYRPLTRTPAVDRAARFLRSFLDGRPIVCEQTARSLAKQVFREARRAPKLGNECSSVGYNDARALASRGYYEP